MCVSRICICVTASCHKLHTPATIEQSHRNFICSSLGQYSESMTWRTLALDLLSASVAANVLNCLTIFNRDHKVPSSGPTKPPARSCHYKIAFQAASPELGGRCRGPPCSAMASSSDFSLDENVLRGCKPPKMSQISKNINKP